MRFGAFPMPPILDTRPSPLSPPRSRTFRVTPGTQFRLDYSVNLNSIPAYSAGDVLSGRVGADKLAGKDVLIGVASDVLGDKYFVPGYGRGYGVYIHAVGAETLKQGRPVDLGWLSALMICLAAAAAALTRKRALERYAILGSSAALLLALPHVLEPTAHLHRHHARPVRADRQLRSRSAGAGSASAAWSIRCRTCPTSTRFAPTATGASMR